MKNDKVFSRSSYSTFRCFNQSFGMVYLVINGLIFKILDSIWLPNITLVEDGVKVCVSSFVAGLQYLLQQPNPNNAKNLEASDEQFEMLPVADEKLNKVISSYI